MAAANLVNQSEALSDFLDDLLCEDVEAPIEADVAPLEEAVNVETASQQEAIPSPQVDIDAHGRRLLIPDWGRSPFAAMVFKVRDLSLAIPVHELAGVIDWQSAKIEQQAGSMLLLGQCQHKGQKLNVVDTARFIFPDDKLASIAERGNSPGLSRIILINNGKIGLACNEVYEMIDIQPSQVTWRSERTRRKWLAGTMLQEMIVLLDATVAADIVAEQLRL